MKHIARINCYSKIEVEFTCVCFVQRSFKCGYSEKTNSYKRNGYDSSETITKHISDNKAMIMKSVTFICERSTVSVVKCGTLV